MSRMASKTRIQQLMLRDQKVVRQRKVFAKKCFDTLDEFERLNTHILQINTRTGEHAQHQDERNAAIAALEKRCTDLDVQLIRAKQAIKKQCRYADKCAAHKLNDEPFHNRDKQLNKSMKLHLLEKSTGIILADQFDDNTPSSSNVVEGIVCSNNDTELRPFRVDARESSHDVGAISVSDRMWTLVAESCDQSNLMQLQAIFDRITVDDCSANGEIMQKV